jgi:Lon protease-like protein
MRVLRTALVYVLVAGRALTLSSAFVPRLRGVASSSYAFSLSSHTISRKQRFSTFRRLAAEEQEDEEDDGPLSKGIDSVSWLPTVIGGRSESILSIREGSEILPLFPLGGLVYTPNSEHVLNIFEPRYRQMYNDILMNGTRRFVVTMSHPTEPGRFAQTGVLFELEDLKEVSEQTADQIKYICNHRVTGRVNLHRIINPDAWESRDTYLKVEGNIMDDTGKDERESKTNDVYGAVAAAVGDSPEEKALCDSFASLVNIQHELEEDVRFTRSSVSTLAVKPGSGENGLWQTIRLWQNYADQRLLARQNELQSDFQAKLQAFLKKERGLKDEELPRYVDFYRYEPCCSINCSLTFYSFLPCFKRHWFPRFIAGVAGRS